jgi:predicted nucleic acid-binding Zn ribbon protein
MPTYDGYCPTDGCCNNVRKVEFLVRRWDSPNPNCPECGAEVVRLVAAPAVVWAKDLGQYNGQNEEGHYAYHRDGNTVEKHFIRTRQDQKEFCKRYGYADPNELPSAPIADEWGRERNTVGEKGSWI